MMSSENKLTDEQLISVTGGKGYKKGDVVVINGKNVNVTAEDLADLVAKDPSQLNPYEKVVLEQARIKGLI